VEGPVQWCRSYILRALEIKSWLVKKVLVMLYLYIAIGHVPNVEGEQARVSEKMQKRTVQLLECITVEETLGGHREEEEGTDEESKRGRKRGREV
jgi:hypothetical protein